MSHKLMFVGVEVQVQDVAKRHPVIRGLVVKETKQTFSLETSKSTITIPKKGNVFTIGAVTIDGEKILSRHEDRLKV